MKHKNFFDVQLIYSILVSNVQQSDPVIHTLCVHISFQILSHYTLLQDIEYKTFLTIGICCLSVI